MDRRWVVAIPLLVIGGLIFPIALGSKHQRDERERAIIDHVIKQELTRKTPNGLTEGGTTALLADRKKEARNLLASHGLSSDGTIGSIKGLDRLVDTDPDAARAGAEALGVYLGEAIRSFAGGTWSGEIHNGRVDWELKLDNGGLIWPVERVRKRINLGPTEGLYAYAGSLAGLGEVIDLSDVQAPARKPARKKKEVGSNRE